MGSDSIRDEGMDSDEESDENMWVFWGVKGFMSFCIIAIKAAGISKRRCSY